MSLTIEETETISKLKKSLSILKDSLITLDSFETLLAIIDREVINEQQ